MEATDLMLNDLVLYRGMVAKVIDIYGNGQVRLCIYGQDIRKSMPAEKLSPIPLTPEILEKNGWNYDDLVHEWYGPMTLYGECPNLIVRDGIEISYVHDIQHAFKQCGIKKEIVV